jgi:hypothetical protein
MRRPLFADESSRFFQSLDAQRAAPRPVLTPEEALAWHRDQGQRQARERARNNYYLTHNSGSALFPGDEELDK